MLTDEPPPSPPLAQTPPLSRWRNDRTVWECALAVALGAALIVFGGLDLRAYHAGLAKPPVTYAFTTPPGGMRVGPDLEFFRHHEDEYVRLENFGALEHLGRHYLRHELGPVSTLEIFVRSARTGRLSFRWQNLISDQTFAVACEGQTIEQMASLPLGELVRSYPLTLHAGRNLVTFACRRYNHDSSRESADPRPIAGTFHALDLSVE